MLQLSVYNRSGEQIDTIEIDEQQLGGIVKKRLLHDAARMYEANRRQGTSSIKTRAEIVRSGAKMYRQKGTGRARHGAAKVSGMRGGANAFGPRPRDYHYRMPRKALRAALQSALLGKMIDKEVLVIDELNFAEPKTSEMAATLANLKIGGSCLVAIEEHNTAAYKSARNIPKVDLKAVSDINAHDVLLRKNVLLTRAALDKVIQRLASEVQAGSGENAE